MTFAESCVDRSLAPWEIADRTVPLYALTWCNSPMHRYSVPMTDDSSTQLLEQRLDAVCARYRAATAELRDARVARSAAVADARAGGLPWSRIADRFGVTKNAPVFWMKHANCEGTQTHG